MVYQLYQPWKVSAPTSGMGSTLLRPLFLSISAQPLTYVLHIIRYWCTKTFWCIKNEISRQQWARILSMSNIGNTNEIECREFRVTGRQPPIPSNTGSWPYCNIPPHLYSAYYFLSRHAGSLHIIMYWEVSAGISYRYHVLFPSAITAIAHTPPEHESTTKMA